MTKTILFVTVGTTAVRKEVDALAEGYDQLGLDLAGLRGSGDRLAAELDRLVKPDLFRRVVGAHCAVWDQSIQDALDLASNTSAEMTSTTLILKDPESGLGGRLVPGRDLLVLLASDTAIGRFCALVNAAVMHTYLLQPACDCGSDFAECGRPLNCPTVKVEIVSGMEARRGLKRLLPRVREICREHAAGFDHVLFNITGGYKGAIPALTWVAANDFRDRARMFYQLEDVRAATQLQFAVSSADEPQETHIHVPRE